jgi:hypothetical protein
MRHGLRFRRGTSGGRGGRFAPERLRSIIESTGKAPAGFFAGAASARKPKEQPARRRKPSPLENLLRAFQQAGLHGKRRFQPAPSDLGRRSRTMRMRRRR